MLFRKKETDRLFTIKDLENLIALINEKRELPMIKITGF